MIFYYFFFFFFFQAEDGIRDATVTGVQTCALPISRTWREGRPNGLLRWPPRPGITDGSGGQRAAVRTPPSSSHPTISRRRTRRTLASGGPRPSAPVARSGWNASSTPSGSGNRTGSGAGSTSSSGGSCCAIASANAASISPEVTSAHGRGTQAGGAGPRAPSGPPGARLLRPGRGDGESRLRRRAGPAVRRRADVVGEARGGAGRSGGGGGRPALRAPDPVGVAGGAWLARPGPAGGQGDGVGGLGAGVHGPAEGGERRERPVRRGVRRRRQTRP